MVAFAFEFGVETDVESFDKRKRKLEEMGARVF